MATDLIRWRDEGRAWRGRSGRVLHIARHCFTDGLTYTAHRHDFNEVFWCEAGRGRHVVNGQHTTLMAGDVVFVRAADEHILGGEAGGLTLVNVSFLPQAVDALARHAGAGWPWRPGPLPLHVRLGPPAMERLHGWAAELAAPQTGPLELAAFLTDLARLVARPPAAEDDLPPWLAEAIAVFAEPANLRGGVPRLAHLAGRGIAHLNRQVRRHRGCTATALVNRLRLEWAARELRMGSQPVAAIADACGVAHLGHFHDLFRERFGTTPRRYRMDAWQVFRP